MVAVDTPIVAALIGVFGAGFFGALGFILTGLRAAILENGAGIKDAGAHIGRLEVAFGRLEERTISEFGQVKDVLARIEATQAEQGRQIEKLSGGQATG